MDIRNIDISKLENLRIHELRDVAREMGVKSPTSLTKEKIIQEVNLIVSGEKEPYFNVRKQGRPTKTEEMDLAGFVNATSGEIDKHLMDWEVNEINPSYILKCNEFEFTKSLPTDRAVMGYVDIHTDGYGLVRRNGFMPSAMDTFIPSSLVQKYSLKSGMFITGVERFVANGKPYALIAVQNRQVIDENYDDLPGGKLGSKVYSYLNIDVLSGGRYLIKNDNAKDIYLNAYDIAQSILKTNKDLDVKLVFTKSVPERLPQNTSNIETLNIPFNTLDRDLINAVNLYINKCKLEALEHRVVVVLTGLTDMAKAYNNVLSGQANAPINANTASKVNNILAAAKNLKDSKAGITLIVVDNMHMTDEMSKLFNYEILDNFSN